MLDESVAAFYGWPRAVARMTPRSSGD